MTDQDARALLAELVDAHDEFKIVIRDNPEGLTPGAAEASAAAIAAVLKVNQASRRLQDAWDAAKGFSGAVASPLQRLAELEQNWDSYGAKPISREAIARCADIHFTPTSDGGVQIELSDGTHDVEVYVAPTGQLNGVMFDRTET